MPVNAPGEGKFEQQGRQRLRIESAFTNEVIHVDGRGREQFHECPGFRLANIAGLQRRRLRFEKAHLPWKPFAAQGFQHVPCAHQQRGAVADQPVGALAARVQRRAGHGEHVAPLFGGKARGNERAGAGRRFHHDQRAGQSGDDAVAAREIVRARHRARHHLGHDHAALADRRVQALIFRRVDHVDAARHHGHRPGVERGLMRRRVDAAREAGDDGMAFAADLPRQKPGELAGDGGGIARPHHRHGAADQQLRIALHAEQGRGIVRLAEQGRKLWFQACDEARADGGRVGHVALGGLQAIELRRAAQSALLRQFRDGAQRLRCGAVALQQGAERGGANVFTLG